MAIMRVSGIGRATCHAGKRCRTGRNIPGIRASAGNCACWHLLRDLARACLLARSPESAANPEGCISIPPGFCMRSVLSPRHARKASRERAGCLAFERLDLLQNRFLLLIELVLHIVERVLRRYVLDENLLPAVPQDLIAIRDEDTRTVLRLRFR